MKITKGLRETPKDERDFQLGALVSLPKLSELPISFKLPALGVKDQKGTDFCTAFASCLISEMQEGIELSPEYSFALSKEISGDPDEWGQDIRTALKVHTKKGALAQKEAPYSLLNKEPEFLRHLKNWPPELQEKIGFHKKKSFFKITGPYDHYDNIRAAIWKFRNEKRGVISGVIWAWPLEEYLLEGTLNQGFGHCISYIGWEKDGLLVQNSAGTEAGRQGLHLMSRATANHFAQKYGAYMMIDLSPEEAKYCLDHGIKIEDNWLIRFFKIIWQ